METFLSIITGLSILAFIVGMLRPAIVKCRSRRKVALVYLGIFIVSVLIGASISEKEHGTIESSSPQTTSPITSEDSQTEIPVLSVGSVYTMEYSNADVKIKFDNIKVNRIPNGGLNLILYLTIKNNSNDIFFISSCNWKLLDSDKIEVEESGIYNPTFDCFEPSTFFFTTVEPNIGKREEVGYSVKAELYYLSINGKIVSQIPLNTK